ncbi:MAG: CDP-glycerol glycerophosphotransferase family protein [Lachnospiraceae bacterium]
MNEKNYIRYRKLKALGNRLCFRFCRIFPVKKKRISVCTFEGRGGFGCNPKYIVEELHRRSSGYEFVWFVNDMEKKFPDYIKKVPNTLWSRAYWLSTSAIWIDNYRKPYGTCKRKGQYYLNTNHYTVAMKSTGLWRGKGFSEMAYLVSKNDSDMIDDLVIDSKWCEDAFGKGMVYSGNYLKTGAPRCDVLFGDRSIWHRAFCRRHGLPEDAKVLMYAPTFREGAKDGKRSVFSGDWSIDFRRLIQNLERKFGGQWYLCIRVHPQLAEAFQEYRDEEIQDRLIDESRADDMYEILAGMDAYMTDYSSAMFDAGFAGIPVFLYADDIEKYAHDRGSLMWNLATDPPGHVTNNKAMTPEIDAVLPFSVARDNGELEKYLMEFDEKRYRTKIDCLMNELKLVFDGNAGRKVADKIEDMCIVIQTAHDEGERR